jgi:hypothetical protein
MFAADRFKSRCRLQTENLFLPHQLNMALRQAPPRFQPRGSDRALLICIKRIGPVCSILSSDDQRPTCGGIALASKAFRR